MIPEWLDLQTRLYSLDPDLFDRPRKGKKGRGADTADDPESAKVQRKIAKIERDVLFERLEAEHLWEQKLDDLRKDATFMRRPVDKKKKSAPTEETQPKSEITEEIDPSLLDIEGMEESLSGMFGVNTEEQDSVLGLPAPEVQASFTVRDFGKSVGLTPRRVLEETCKSRDSSSTVVFQDLSSSSHSNRKALEVRWSKPQEVPFLLAVDSVTHKSNALATFISMDSLVTPDAQQAENYVSTLALFILFPQNSKEGKSYLRLPTAWRDLWTEFATIQKAQQDEIDKNTLKDLKRLIQENPGTFEDDVVLSDNFRKRNGNGSKPGTPVKGSGRDMHTSINDRLKEAWIAKAATPSYYRMAQGRMGLPIWGFKDEILNTLDDNRVLIICSETGSGKSTQIPSFVLEHEMSQGRHCKIYVTEPRRISAISLARRVSEELGESKNDVGTNRSLVGFAVRLESKFTQSTPLIYA